MVVQQNVTVNIRSFNLSGMIILDFVVNLLFGSFLGLLGRSAVSLIWGMSRSIRLIR
jgi:hypothetical protein